MSGFYLFHHGITCLVVKVLSVSDDGQATCKIARRVHEPGKNSPGYYRWLHTQPGFDDEIVLPFAMLRSCPYNVKIRRPYKAPEPFQWHKLIFAACLVISFFILVRGPEPVQDKTSVALLAQAEEECNEAKIKADFAHKKLGKDWSKWSRYYYETGRNDNQLVDDCNFCGGPQLAECTDPDCEHLDRLEAEQN